MDGFASEQLHEDRYYRPVEYLPVYPIDSGQSTRMVFSTASWLLKAEEKQGYIYRRSTGNIDKHPTRPLDRTEHIVVSMFTMHSKRRIMLLQVTRYTNPLGDLLLF
jgi:hypothetical protein